MKNKKITIAGAGISGLTAAINLAKAGFKVTIHEKNKQVGMRYHDDFQGIENWTTEEDALQEIRRHGIITDFYYKPYSKMYLVPPSLKKYKVQSNIPNYYLVKRGPGEGTLDTAILKQAESMGIKILYQSKINHSDIIATGNKKVSAMGQGIKFKTDAPDVAVTMMNNNIAPGGYAYMFIVNNEGLIMTWYFKNFSKGKHLLDDTIKLFDEVHKVKKKDIKKIGGVVDFHIQKNYEEKGILVGEAAGFQDYTASFGIRLAIKSGYLAAQSIINKKSYNESVKKEIMPQLKTSITGRYLWEKMNNKIFENFVRKASEMKDTNKLLKKMYSNSYYKNVLLLFAKKQFKKRGILENKK